METKVCTKCGKEKDLSHFWKESRNKSGYNNVCKECKTGKMSEEPITNSTLIKSDIKGSIAGYPVEVVMLMLHNQVSQGNKEDLSVFINKKDALKREGGFDWRDTEDGVGFWSNIHNGKNFQVFFERYGTNKIESKKLDLNEVKTIGYYQVQDNKNLPKWDPPTTITTSINYTPKFKDRILIWSITQSKYVLAICIFYSEKLNLVGFIFEEDSYLIKSGNAITTYMTNNFKRAEKIKLSLQDISEGKGVGIPADLIEII